MSLMLKMLFKAIGPKTFNKFAEKCQNPNETQENLLKYIISQNRKTKYGKEHDFDKIRTFADFQSEVPISTYEDLSPYIERALNGEPEQLTKRSPVFFATTSGTTGKPKYIPVTPDGKSLKSQLLRAWFAKLFMDHPSIFDDKVLSVVSPEVESYAPSGIPCGAESGHGYRSMPKASVSSYSCPYDVYAIKDYETKYYVLLRIAASHSITLIYSVNPSTVILLAQRLKQFSEDIIRDVRDGAISKKYPVSQQLEKLLKHNLRPNPQRAHFLEKAASRGGGKLLPKHVWPNLAAIGCWKGGSVGMYVSKFDQYYPEGTPVRDCGYYASEHRGSVPISDDDSSGVLAIPTNVYEFFPASEDRKPGPTDLLRPHQLKKGEQYYIYVTTAAGLYRYDMNDIIEVTDFYQKTPMLRFVQKGKGFISFTGEKLSEAQVIAAIQKALTSYLGNYEFIAAVGEMGDVAPRYAFLTEFETSLKDDEAKSLAHRIEKELSLLNIEYEGKRKSKRLEPLVLRIVLHGEFSRYRKQAVEGGKNDGQFKILRLTKDQNFAKAFRTEKEFSG
jgi:hypothetical protein